MPSRQERRKASVESTLFLIQMQRVENHRAAIVPVDIIGVDARVLRRRPGSSDRCGTPGRWWRRPASARSCLRCSGSSWEVETEPSCLLPSCAEVVSVHASLRLDVLDLVRHGVGVHRAVIDGHLVRGVVEPGQGVLHPVLVVALGEILAGMGAAGFLAVGGAFHGDDGLADQVVEFQRLEQVGVPDQRAVRDLDVGGAAPDLVDELLALVQNLAGAEHRAVVLHGLLHLRGAAPRSGVEPLA